MTEQYRAYPASPAPGGEPTRPTLTSQDGAGDDDAPAPDPLSGYRRAPSPYVGFGSRRQRMPRQPRTRRSKGQSRRRGRRRGSAQGDLDIRATRRFAAGALIGWGLAFGFVFSRIDEPMLLVLAGVVLAIPCLPVVLHSMFGAVQVVDDTVHIRTVTRVARLRLNELDRALLVTQPRYRAVHLRRRDGTHVVTLTLNGWDATSLDMLARRLDAIELTDREADDLEHRYPGSRSWAARHSVLLVGVVAALVVAVLAVAVLATRS